MKFIPLRDFDIVTSALNFDTLDCRVTGGCDLYTTKAAGSDKKLYKDIDKSLESQHAALIKLGASLSPPQREEMEASQVLSRSSPFGNLTDISSRRTFAYLIATLNASHPDYDFSHVLRPADFRRERNLRKVMSLVDSTLGNLRPIVIDSTVGSMGNGASVGSASSSTYTSPSWGPQMWALINKEMHLQDCAVFSYQPENNPFDEEDGAIWTMHYFFVSKALKRVAYMYVRGMPLMSHSPQLQPRQRMSHQHYAKGSSIAIAGGRSRMASRRDSRARRVSSSADDRISTSFGLVPVSTSFSQRPSLSLQSSGLSTDGADASKRARYWLGDNYADQLEHNGLGDVEDDDENMDEVLMWRPDDINDDDDYGDNSGFMDDDDVDFDEDDDVSILDSDEDMQEEESDDATTRKVQMGQLANALQRPARAMSEEIAGRMDIE